MTGGVERVALTLGFPAASGHEEERGGKEGRGGKGDEEGEESGLDVSQEMRKKCCN